MLTIGQLAARAGVTVRAVRHYHQRGLLAEPERDASGYRRYTAQAVVDLIRIKTLADAGVPLARIDQLLGAEPEEFAQAVADIDRALAKKARELNRHRRRIAALAAGDRLFISDEMAQILDRQRAMNFSEQMIRIERDVLIIIEALSPESIPAVVATKNAALDDPEFVRVYHALDEAIDWDPRDPRLPALAADVAAWAAGRPQEDAISADTVSLMLSRSLEFSPAWRRLLQLQ
ncbi:MerR family transcriptional regulator [Nonomuraea endophytica]|uniref:DNA-binding transcriptional MerR regulator n=1 Tax=Nonomuraea endophytica TaxID=714136 RepID=A0A7W8EJN4_9ACTN|nr:MerR family transcriptional regulator [Nonomuraea endophytica]MBB5081758.1 DNA-binding transcriptional MerR regulator [Nonomuraea endophytica]